MPEEAPSGAGCSAGCLLTALLSAAGDAPAEDGKVGACACSGTDAGTLAGLAGLC